MNELQLYHLLKTIAGHSTILAGRFAVAKSWGASLNQENFGAIVTDALGGLTTIRKYPAHILMPPVELVEAYTNGWSTYRMVSLFVAQPYQSDGQPIDPNLSTNQSHHTVEQCWKDMTVAAKDFRTFFDNTVRDSHLLSSVRADITRQDTIERISNTGNDLVAGVMLTWTVKLFNGCVITDYGSRSIQYQIPEEPHPHHAL